MNLFGLDTISEEDRREVARRNLNNLLTSYADEADVFNEIIQNSYDAVMRAIREDLYTNGSSPTIRIIIGRRTEGHHYLFVADNGVGMSPEVAQNLTVPGFSYGKKKGKTVGYKGVGASYFFAASQRISLHTIDTTHVTTEYTVRGSYEWIKNEDEPEPVIELSSDIPDKLKPFLPDQRGTSIYFQFHDGIKPKNLNGIVVMGDGPEFELKNWVCFLASKTALGAVDDLAGLGIKIEMMLDLGDEAYEQSWTLGEFNREGLIIGYPFPHRVFKTGKSIAEIDSTPPEQQYKHSRKYSAVFKRWTAEEIIEGVSNLDSSEEDKLRQHLNWVDGYLCYSTDVLREVNSRLGGRSHLIRHGLRIAVDGIPQGRNVDLSLTSSQGLDRQSHIVIAFRGLELDTGRKISADEVVASAITKIGQRVVNVIKEYRWAMKKRDRPDITSDLETWRSSIDARSQTSLVRELYHLNNLPPVFRVDPDNEAEVISLFVSLIGQAFIKGFRLQALSGYARYDSLCDVDSQSASVRNLDDSLSVRDAENGPHGSAKVLEFKYSFDSLIQDFEDKVKNPLEIDVAVCWSLPDLNTRRGRIEPTYGEWRDNRTVYAGSYIWFDDNDSSQFPILVLRNIVAELVSRYENAQNKPGIGTAMLAQIQQGDKDALI